MAHSFLSDEWMDAVEALRDEAPDPPPGADEIVINAVITDTPYGAREAHFAGGTLERGLIDAAPTKITVPYEVALDLFVKGQPEAAMQAFMGGKIKVEGDMTKILALQAVIGQPGPEHLAFQQRIRDLTAETA